MTPTYEIIGPDGTVHYRRQQGHPDIAEAQARDGHSVRNKPIKFHDWKVMDGYCVCHRCGEYRSDDDYQGPEGEICKP
jgi:hypothetical protein